MTCSNLLESLLHGGHDGQSVLERVQRALGLALCEAVLHSKNLVDRAEKTRNIMKIKKRQRGGTGERKFKE